MRFLAGTSRSALAAVFCLLGGVTAQAQVSFLTSDGPGETYERIQSAGYNTEVPDCGHPGRHIEERFDAELGKNVFAFTMHMTDDDRCTNTDRQRIELRGAGAAQQGARGKTTYYRWKFKLPVGFRETPNFTHIFQIKAYGNGHGSGAPIVTITPRSPDRMEIFLRGVVKSGTLAPYKGTWVEAWMKTRHDNGGSLEVILRKVSDGSVMLQYATGSADLWDDGAGYGAPKFGLYRSLDARSQMRDEDVLFADIMASVGEVEPVVLEPRVVLAAGPAAPRRVFDHRMLFLLPGWDGRDQGGFDASGKAWLPGPGAGRRK